MGSAGRAASPRFPAWLPPGVPPSCTPQSGRTWPPHPLGHRETSRLCCGYLGQHRAAGGLEGERKERGTLSKHCACVRVCVCSVSVCLCVCVCVCVHIHMCRSVFRFCVTHECTQPLSPCVQPHVEGCSSSCPWCWGLPHAGGGQRPPQSAQRSTHCAEGSGHRRPVHLVWHRDQEGIPPHPCDQIL